MSMSARSTDVASGSVGPVVRAELVAAAAGVAARASGFALAYEALGRLTHRLLSPQRRSDVPPAELPAPFAPPVDLSLFLSVPLTRSVTDAIRIVYAGELSPLSGVADFLACVVEWAECHPATPVQLLWVGQGDLQGVIRAQPLPSNLQQEFAGGAPDELPACFARSGLLVVPSLLPDARHMVAEAMAAGLPVLGSRRCRDVEALVRHGVTGWLFDPLRSEQMAAALDSALTTPTARLAEMRMAARAWIGARQGEQVNATRARRRMFYRPDLLHAGRPA